MTQDKFTVAGDQLTGRGLTFDVTGLFVAKAKSDPEVRRQCLAEIGEAIYLQGRESILPSWDDRFDLRGAVEALRALAVVVGFPASERHRRAADVIERLLHAQEKAS